MIHLVSKELESYCTKHTVQETPLIHNLVKETFQATDLPQMMVGPIEGNFLKMLARLIQAKRILEIGTFTGYSSLAMAEGLSENGLLITCDNNEEYTNIAKKYWQQSPYGKKIKLKLGPALETLKTIEGPFDMVFIDADKENYSNYWEACLPKVRRGGLLVADNVLWSGGVLHPQSASDHAICKFNDLVSKDARVEAVMLTIRDGMTLAWKK